MSTTTQASKTPGDSLTVRFDEHEPMCSIDMDDADMELLTASASDAGQTLEEYMTEMMKKCLTWIITTNDEAKRLATTLRTSCSDGHGADSAFVTFYSQCNSESCLCDMQQFELALPWQEMEKIIFHSLINGARLSKTGI